MNFWDFSRGPASVHLLLEFGRRRGLAPSALLAGTRLTLMQLNTPESQVTPGQELGVIGNLLRLRPAGTAMGLELGLAYHSSIHGVLGLGMMSRATPLDALVWSHRFLSLTYTYARIVYDIAGEVVTIRFDPPPALAADLQAFVVERAVGAVACVVRDVAGSFSPIGAIRLSTPAPSSEIQAGLQHQLACPLRWGADASTMILSRPALQQPAPQANATTAAMCQRMCEDLIERRRTRLSTATLVQEFLATAPDRHTPRLAEVAALLCTSERTLKRWFQGEGVSFRELCQASRLARANRLLAHPGNSLTEVAARLGFSDLSSFSQAYKRWTGVAPSASAWRALSR